MSRYAIFCYEQLYGGLHGMNITSVIEADFDGEVNDYCEQLACDVIDSYSAISDTLYEEAKESVAASHGIDIKDFCEDNYEDEFNECLQDLYQEDIAFEWSIVNEARAGQYSTEELDDMCYNMTYDDFIKDYCYPN